MKKLAFAFCFLFAGTAQANGYFGFGIGQSSADIEGSACDVIVFLLGPPCAGSVDDSGTAFKVFGGSRISPNFAFEGFYVDFGKFSSSGAGPTATLDIDFEGSAFGGAVLGIAPVSPSVDVFGKFGMARWSVDLSATATGPGGFDSASESDDGFDPLLGFGLQFKTGSVFIRGEFERFMDVGDEETTGQSDVDVISLSVIFQL